MSAILAATAFGVVHTNANEQRVLYFSALKVSLSTCTILHIYKESIKHKVNEKIVYFDIYCNTK